VHSVTLICRVERIGRELFYSKYMIFIFGATTVPIVCLLKLLACSNLKACRMLVAVRVICSEVVLGGKKI